MRVNTNNYLSYSHYISILAKLIILERMENNVGVDTYKVVQI